MCVVWVLQEVIVINTISEKRSAQVGSTQARPKLDQHKPKISTSPRSAQAQDHSNPSSLARLEVVIASFQACCLSIVLLSPLVLWIDLIQLNLI